MRLPVDATFGNMIFCRRRSNVFVVTLSDWSRLVATRVHCRLARAMVRSQGQHARRSVAWCEAICTWTELFCQRPGTYHITSLRVYRRKAHAYFLSARTHIRCCANTLTTPVAIWALIR